MTAFLPAIAQDVPERDQRCRTSVSATFLAGLELARDGTVELAQDQLWASLRMNRPETTKTVQA